MTNVRITEQPQPAIQLAPGDEGAGAAAVAPRLLRPALLRQALHAFPASPFNLYV